MKVLSTLSIYRLIFYIFFIEGDTRYAVVEWNDENSYGVIGFNCFLKLKEEYRLDEIYKVKWVDSSIYEARIISIGEF
jgi:hypothetical protein